ncbi:nitric oxide reductase transcriptional regulator NorR [Pseudoalteromonas sp. MMG013]|uniref:nitric oxide reductase transcriptional regulator NorR n=1 Tax=Pseudoalteromonas sp. MMG013 TaxID=2822687 RepID=UPI001B364B3E|nr:nitric oxide reductase transcriptional regulator NorR [Pseudoalteromonas sp. MMG013]MBQ4863692.1 nitric oxide reductase transcriptional regulator NorR [Pseudoalteromonas sp. MMG013]
MDQRSLSQLLTLSSLLTKALPKKTEQNLNQFYSAVVQAIKTCVSADAVALLLHQQGALVPAAIDGLTRDTFGRRFNIEDHPRLLAISSSTTPIIFNEHSELPDPYDGLLLAQEGDIPVHACMGIPLYHQHTLQGVLTLDSLTPGMFKQYPMPFLQHINDILAEHLNVALYHEQLLRKAQHGDALVSELNQAAHDMVGNSTLMQSLKSDIELVASSDFTVLVLGETGTGKELVARNIHGASRRSNQVFVQVNCASLPESLAESEFFGHRKGAFTGADKHRDGKFLLADGGTLFLDEIGELPLNIQSKLLRVLQSGEIQPVGADNTQHVDVRIVAATNRDLKTEVQAGRFRADLYHRLSVYPLQVPPLRARQDDIPLLAGFFIEQVRKKLGIGQLTLSHTLSQSLSEYDWPGNIRELEHVISRSALKAKQAQWQQDIVRIELIHSELSQSEQQDKPVKTAVVEVDSALPFKEAVDNFQKSHIIAALKAHKLNWAATARALQMDRANLVRLAKRLGIKMTKNL